MTTAAKDTSALKSLSGDSQAPTYSEVVGKAEVVGEETGTCTRRAAAAQVQSSGERLAEKMSGRAIAQQGLATTCKDPYAEAKCRRRWEDGGPAHEPIRARKKG